MMAASLAGGAAVGAAAGVALNVVMSLPAPGWSSALVPDEILSIAVTVGAVITIASVRIGRALVRRMREYNAARLETLAELLALRAGEGDRED
jgi:hypothetical protein